MVPAATVAGLYFAHPEARYFAIDRITRDQAAAYARQVYKLGIYYMLTLGTIYLAIGGRIFHYDGKAWTKTTEWIKPMREELTALGFSELRTVDDVDEFMANTEGTALLVINSVCGCAAGQARPGVRMALEAGGRPDRLATVFAGQVT